MYWYYLCIIHIYDVGQAMPVMNNVNKHAALLQLKLIMGWIYVKIKYIDS